MSSDGLGLDGGACVLVLDRKRLPSHA